MLGIVNRERRLSSFASVLLIIVRVLEADLVKGREHWAGRRYPTQLNVDITVRARSGRRGEVDGRYRNSRIVNGLMLSWAYPRILLGFRTLSECHGQNAIACISMIDRRSLEVQKCLSELALRSTLVVAIVTGRVFFLTVHLCHLDLDTTICSLPYIIHEFLKILVYY